MNQYELSRAFWDFVFENPEKVRPAHIAIYFFAMEHCNRLGWKDKFGLPTTMVKEAIGIDSYHTYKKHFDDLAQWGFFKVIEYSKNQHSSNIIAFTKNVKADVKAPIKALDKALSKHLSKQSQSTCESNNTIDKQETIEQETINKDLAKPNPKPKPIQAIENAGIKLSEKCMKLWLDLCATKKWKSKELPALELSLTKLSNYQDEFKIDLLERAISGSYQGLVFSNTDLEYSKWLQNHITLPSAPTPTKFIYDENDPKYKW